MQNFGFGENIPDILNSMMTIEIDKWIGGWKNGLMDGWEDEWMADRTDGNSILGYIWKRPLETSKVEYFPNTVT